MAGPDRTSTRDKARFDDPDVARRRDEALARLLKMPPKPHEQMKLGRSRRRTGKAAPPREDDASRRSRP